MTDGTNAVDTPVEVEPKAPKNLNAFSTTESNADGARTIDLEYDFGTNMDESIAKFSEEVIHASFVKQAKVVLQARVRDLMKAGKTDDEIKEAITQWVPGIRQPRAAAATTVDKLMKAVGKMSAEDKAKIMAALGISA
jgi:hypothetical protein